MSDKQETPRTDKEWSGKTGGTRWMQLSLIGMFRHINPVCLYPLVCVWILFYILFDPTSRHGSWAYWSHRAPTGMAPVHRWFWRVGRLYRHYLEFGIVILDRFAAYSGRTIKVTIEGKEILDQLNARPEGYLVLGTHIGNQELAGYTFPMPKPMYVLVHVGDTETVNTNRREAFERMGLHIIPVRRDGSHVLEMHNALSDGNILSVHGDRLFFGTKSIVAPIFGQDAHFPEGPFRIAVSEQLPTISLFMMRERAGEYTLHVRLLSDGNYTEQRRTDRVNHLLQRYIAANEEMLHLYPYQWFHFYDFWK